MKPRPLFFVLLFFSISVAWGQAPASAVHLNSGVSVINTIIYGNSENQPLSENVLGNHSAFDAEISGNQNIHLTENPFTTFFRIDATSPLFNAGTTEGLRVSDAFDLDGNPRFSACAIDIGAFEVLYNFPPIQLFPSISEPNNSTCDNGRILITVLNQGYAYDFFWEQNGYYFSTNRDLTNIPTGEYKLFIQRQGHVFCEADTFSFSLTDCHYTPSLRLYSLYISPNNDGHNDYLYIPNIGLFPNNTVTIFNTYGEIIFREQNYDNVNVRWEGQNRSGHIVPDGVYYYIVETEGFQVMGGWIFMRISN